MTAARTRGVVTDVQRFSVHDGPGIRTTVFLKGCNLRCVWCHNPETIPLGPQLAFIAANCVSCGDCVAACRNGAIGWSGPRGGAWGGGSRPGEDGCVPRAGRDGRDGRDAALESRETPVTDFSRCRACFDCVDACVAGARVVIGRTVEPAALAAEVLVDKPYYGDDGGVTFSGGEPLLQKDFIAAVAELCRAEGVGCAVETALCFPWTAIEDVLRRLEPVMFDIKALDSDLHKRLTGRPNRAILANARRLAEAKRQVIVRTPVIPGLNDSEIPAIAEFVASLGNALYYELLPYNPFAEEKFARLGKPFALNGLQPPSRVRMRALVDQAARSGVKVKQMED
ncbi:MAG: glycyl-radical enzyme activating protein [Bifidobacteriaceae bacterium]|nr:glycyl-radical enzyme activating protein [Bifidobacteriaceae bacterium]